MKYLSTIAILLLLSTEENIPSGQFYSSNGFDHYTLNLKKNHQFIQQNGSCDWSYQAKGTWSTNGDTIHLVADEIYDLHGSRRKKLVNTKSYSYDLFQRYNKCLIISYDTIGLFRTDENGKILRTIKLHLKE
jgi:hypothetical protein